MPATEVRLDGVWWGLRLALGAGILLAGADKFFDRLATWSMYLAPLAERVLPVGGDALLRAAGVLEVAIGLAILTRWPRAGAYALAAWMLATSVNLALARSFWDLVVRDLQLAVAALALARLTEWRAERVGATGAEVARAARPEVRDVRG